MKNPQCILYFLLLVFLNSCTARYIVGGDLQKDITRLRKHMTEVQKNQADLATSMDSLDNTMTNLGGKLEDTKQRMSLLTQRMDDINADLTQRIDILNTRLSPEELSPIAPSPSELYKLAYADYSRGKYDIAINGFRAYMDEYPKTELAGSAQYYMGESYFKKKQYKKAVGEFDKFTDAYPHNDFVPSAKYKKALCQLELNDKKYAKKILEYVIKNYPDSPEAKQAKNKLKSISSP